MARVTTARYFVLPGQHSKMDNGVSLWHTYSKLPTSTGQKKRSHWFNCVTSSPIRISPLPAVTTPKKKVVPFLDVWLLTVARFTVKQGVFSGPIKRDRLFPFPSSLITLGWQRNSVSTSSLAPVCLISLIVTGSLGPNHLQDSRIFYLLPFKEKN